MQGSDLDLEGVLNAVDQEWLLYADGDLELDEAALEALVIAEEISAFAEEIAEQLAEDWCRSQDTVVEIEQRRLCAGVALAPVLSLPIPAVQFGRFAAGCRAA